MRRSVRLATSVAAVTSSLAVRPVAAGLVVEQVEAYDGGATNYAAIDFAGAPTQTPTTGPFAGITFHADRNSSLSSTASGHAAYVGSLFFGSPSSPAAGQVSDVYAAAADQFLTYVVKVQTTTGVAAAPDPFDGGALVINNSYVGDFAPKYPAADLDSQRRIDFMVARDDVTFVASAATGITAAGSADPVVWSSYNALSVSGQQTFDPTNSPGKPHADLSLPTEASYGAGTVSGYAAGLVGHATTAAQLDGRRGTVVRSLLMAGADKTTYASQTANHLDRVNGAGQPDYDASFAILEAGEKPLIAVGGSAGTGTPGTTQQGWTSGAVSAGGQSVVLFTAANAVTGLQASLNWDVTSATSTAADGTLQINTSTGAVQFPALTLEVRPVTYSNGQFVLGSSTGDASLLSAATGDNVQYLNSTANLAAGTYAFVIGGDATSETRVGLSFELRGTFATRYAADTGGSWDTAANWDNGIANGPGAVATFPGATAATVTLDGDRRVGQLTLGGGGYTIAPGTGGTLTIDDSGDSTGAAAPAIHVLAGTHAITAPVALANGLTVATASGSALTIGPVAGTGGLTKTGPGGLVLAGANTFAGTVGITAGTLAVNGSLAASAPVMVGTAGTLTGTGAIAGAVSVSGTITAGSGATADDTTGVLQSGVQTWLAGSTYAVKLDPAHPSAPAGTSADQLVISTLSGDSTGLNVGPVFLSTGSFAAGSYTFVIAEATGSPTAFNALYASGALTLSTPPQGTTEQLGVTTDGGEGQELVLTLTVAAPEPTGMLLLAMAATPLCLGRQRRVHPRWVPTSSVRTTPRLRP